MIWDSRYVETTSSCCKRRPCCSQVTLKILQYIWTCSRMFCRQVWCERLAATRWKRNQRPSKKILQSKPMPNPRTMEARLGELGIFYDPCSYVSERIQHPVSASWKDNVEDPGIDKLSAQLKRARADPKWERKRKEKEKASASSTKPVNRQLSPQHGEGVNGHNRKRSWLGTKVRSQRHYHCFLNVSACAVCCVPVELLRSSWFLFQGSEMTWCFFCDNWDDLMLVAVLAWFSALIVFLPNTLYRFNLHI
jgi:hypothetical protein